jgi:cell wall-associated NlpC family hydrolase
MRWARHRRGCWYAWGGTSCQHGFDCSGLVQTAYRHAGVTLPRTTSGMLASSKLVRVARPKMGDLAFYGSGHVELVTRHWRRSTYGAQQSGTRVGWHRYGGSWQPSGFYRVRGGG